MTTSGKLAIKVCGMRYTDNIAAVASLNPDYMGFILYKGSPRYIELREAERYASAIPSPIMKVAVIVDEHPEYAKRIALSGVFDLIQLHGHESADYCKEISKYIELIKVFRISDKLPSNLKEFEPHCKMLLFDTAAGIIGGTGLKFDHRILENYSCNKRYLLGGGISPEDSGYLKTINAEGITGVDLNSRFEVSPGLKNIELLKHFITNLRTSNDYT